MSARTSPRPLMVMLAAVAIFSLLAMISPVAADEPEGSADPACEEAMDPPAEECEEPAEPEPEPSEEPAPAEDPEPPPVEEGGSDPTEPAEDPEAPPADGDGSEPTEPAPEPEPVPGEDVEAGTPKASSPPAAKAKDTSENAPSGDHALLGASAGPSGDGQTASAPFVYLGGEGSTEGLIEMLRPLAKQGIPLKKALLRVTGPFPVAGLSWWTNDWHAPRCCPEPHLHKGIDMFAEEGTPLVAIADGVVSQKGIGTSAAGLYVEITDDRGVQYFYAHLSGFPEDLEAGQEVRRGEVVGYVGDTGNARGTMPHLHLEVQPNGVSVPPIPFVERWLKRAEKRAARLVERITGQAPAVAPPAATTISSSVVTPQLLEHPAVPSGGAVPTSVEALDGGSSAIDAPAGTAPATRPAVEGAAREATRSWPATESSRVDLVSLGLLLAVGMMVLVATLGRRALGVRSRRKRLAPDAGPVEAVPLPEPPRSSTDGAPDMAGSERSERDGGLVGAGSTTLLLTVWLMLVLVRRARR